MRKKEAQSRKTLAKFSHNMVGDNSIQSFKLYSPNGVTKRLDFCDQHSPVILVISVMKNNVANQCDQCLMHSDLMYWGNKEEMWNPQW